MGHAPVLHTVRRGGDVLGYLAVDSVVDGRACGGVRLMPDVDGDEMIGLARAMTLKFGFLGLPQGGAKAGVRGDPEAPLEERRHRLAEFARAIRPMLAERRFLPHADMGTTTADIRATLSGLGIPLHRRELRSGSRRDSGYYTAVSVLAATRAAARRRGLRLAGCSAAIEGFGKVGAPLASLLVRDGATVVAISTSRGAIHDPRGLDVDRLVQEARVHGSRVVEVHGGGERLDRSALLEIPADLLLPCARHRSIHAVNVDRVEASVVCPGANNPLAPGMEERLASRGVLVVPDFLANSGGVLGGTMAFASVPRDVIERIILERVESRVHDVFAAAEQTGELPCAVAEGDALRAFACRSESATRPGPMGRIFGLALDAYRRGLLPARLVGAVAPRWFGRTLG